MVTEQQIEEELAIAFSEIGAIEPYFDQDVGAWIFSHEAYPVEYGGARPDEVVEGYRRALRAFITERMQGNLEARTEAKTKGRGGKRR